MWVFVYLYTLGLELFLHTRILDLTLVSCIIDQECEVMSKHPSWFEMEPVDGFVLSALTQQWFALFSRHLLLNWDFKTKHPSSSAREEVLRPLVAIFIKPTHDLMLLQHKAISKCNTLTHPALSCNKTVLCYDLWFKKKYIWKKKRFFTYHFMSFKANNMTFFLHYVLPCPCVRQWFIGIFTSLTLFWPFLLVAFT